MLNIEDKRFLLLTIFDLSEIAVFSQFLLFFLVSQYNLFNITNRAIIPTSRRAKRHTYRIHKRPTVEIYFCDKVYSILSHKQIFSAILYIKYSYSATAHRYKISIRIIWNWWYDSLKQIKKKTKEYKNEEPNQGLQRDFESS